MPGGSSIRSPSATCSAPTCATPSTRSRRRSSGGRPSSQSWLTDPDEPGSWEADYEVLAVDGDTYVAHGRTRYLTDDRSAIDREFANVFVCRFDDEGRCREFTEWYMRRRPEALPD